MIFFIVKQDDVVTGVFTTRGQANRFCRGGAIIKEMKKYKTFSQN